MRKVILIFVIQQLLYHVSRVESLIGENITPIRGGEFPFVASFQHFPGEQNFCGGALITKEHVITLAYCLDDVSRESFRIVFEVAHEQGPVLTYTAASWTTYFQWAQTQRIPYDSIGAFNVAIVTLTDKVYHVRPVPLNGLPKGQLVGTEATMIGWWNDVLSKATANLLSEEDYERNIRVLRNSSPPFDDRVLCTVSSPYALLSDGDVGSPLLHIRDNSLMGIGVGFGPTGVLVQGNFSIDFIRQHQVNIYMNVHYYRLFIHSVAPAAPGA